MNQINSRMHWAPDSSYFLISCGGNYLCLLAGDGSRMIMTTSQPEGVAGPVWSADGTAYLYTYGSGVQTSLVTRPVSSGSPTTILTNASEADWRP